MNDAKMTIRIPTSDLEFAKAYAHRSGFSLTSLISRYLARLHSLTEGDIPTEIENIVGIVPPKVDVREEYHMQHLRKV